MVFFLRGIWVVLKDFYIFLMICYLYLYRDLGDMWLYGFEGWIFFCSGCVVILYGVLVVGRGEVWMVYLIV